MRKVIITDIFIIGILYLASSAVALEYDPTYPPTLFPNKIIIEKGYEAFQFIEKDLLIPDKVEYNGRIYEIVQVGEEDGFEPIAVFELNGFFDSQKAKAPQDKLPEPLLVYKQSMWVLGLEISSRDYKISQYEVTRSDGFRVDFQEGISGKIMARVTLYQDKPEPLEEIKETLKSLKTEIQKLQDNIKEGSSEISKKISEVKEKSDSLQMKVASIENTHQNQVKEIQTIKDDLQNLESRVINILKESY